MRVEFLGTGGFHPNERRHTACVMLPEIGVLFDAGSSVFRVPKRLVTGDLQIFLTHAHLDHIVGLPNLLVPMLKGEIKRARVYGTSGTLEAVRNNLFADAVFPVDVGYEYVELASEVRVPQNGTLRHVTLNHPGGSVGFRIDWPDRSLAYITDTFADGSYLDFIQGVDLLIHECNYGDEMAEWSEKTGHSNTTLVVRAARDAKVGKLVLIHIDPQKPDDDPIGLEAAREIFPNTDVAEDEMIVDF